MFEPDESITGRKAVTARAEERAGTAGSRRRVLALLVLGVGAYATMEAGAVKEVAAGDTAAGAAAARLHEDEVRVAQATVSTDTIRRFTHFESRDLSAEAISRLNVATASSCELACREETSCIAYTYDQWNRACFLKAETGELMINARSVSGVLSGYGTPEESRIPITMEFFNGKAFPDFGFRPETARSRDACSQICMNDEFCVVFTFATRSGECRLYEQGSEYFTRGNHMSGAKRQK